MFRCKCHIIWMLKYRFKILKENVEHDLHRCIHAL
ncbi:transposase [Enterovibrio coralii]